MLVFSLAVLLLAGLSDARSAKRGHGRDKRQAEQSLAPEGILESPNYPNSYPLSKTQSYTISMPDPNAYYNVMFHFDDIDIEFQDKCSWDYLLINGIDKICGQPTLKDYVATEVQGSLKVVFVSDYMVNAGGFHANYSSVKLDDGCTDHPCNNGTCNPEGRNGYNCDCSYGYNGSNCEHYNKCLDMPCMSGGSCEDEGQGQYHCACPYGYYGNHCEEYNKCMDFPCMNNGTCEDKGLGQYHCACPYGHYGNHCEEYNKCLDSPCMNNGTCEDKGQGQYHCECPYGFYGNHCNEKVVEDYYSTKPSYNYTSYATTKMPHHNSSSGYEGYSSYNTTHPPTHPPTQGGSSMSLSKIYNLLELAKSKSTSSKNRMKDVQEKLKGLNDLLQ